MHTSTASASARQTSTKAARKSRHLSPYFIKRLSSWLVLSTVLAVSVPQEATAATQVWGGTNSTWDTGTTLNWAGGVAWTDGNIASFTAAGLAFPAVSIDAAGVTANGLQFSANGYSIDGPGTLNLGGATPTFTVTNAGETATVTTAIAGSTGIVKAGLGTLLLTADNSAFLSGASTVSSGVLALTNLGALGFDATTVAASATLQLNAAASGNLTSSVVLDGGTLIQTAANQVAFATSTLMVTALGGTVNVVATGPGGKVLVNAGNLSGDVAGTLTKSGNGTLQLAGANGFMFSNVNVTAGQLELQNFDALGGLSGGAITVGGTGEIVASGVGIPNAVTVNAGATLSGNGSGGADFQGAINLVGNANIALRLFQATATPNNLKISGALTGAGNLNVTAPKATTTAVSSLLLTGNNTAYTGTITIGANAQVRALEGAGVDGLGASAITLGAGGTLGISPTITAAGGTAGFKGNYYYGTALGTGVNFTQSITNGVIGGYDFGLAATGAGVVRVPDGVRTDATIAFPTFNSALPGGFTPAGGAAAPTNFGILWTGILNVTTGGSYTFNTASDDGSLLYVDGQPVVLNDFSQGVVTRSGVITLPAGFHSLVVKYGQGTGGSGMTANYSGPDTGSSLVVLGSIGGTVTNNNAILQGTSTIDNNITLTAGGASAIDMSATTVTSTGSLTFASNSRLNLTGLTGSEVLTQQGAVTLNGANILSVGAYQIGGNQQNNSSGADIVFSGAIGEAVAGSSLVKVGPRNVTLSNTNNYTGVTNYTGGTLLSLNAPGGNSIPGNLVLAPIQITGVVMNAREFANNQIADTANVTLTGFSGIAGANLDLNGFNDTIGSFSFVNNQGTSALTVSTGAGTLTLNGNVFATGTSTGASQFTGNLNLGGATRTFTTQGTGAPTIAAVLTNGSITKAGLGSLLISGANPAYTGLTTVNTGKLTVSNAGALGTTATAGVDTTIVNSGGYLDISGGITVAETLTLNGRGQPVLVSTGPSGGPMYTGALQGSGGATTGVESGNITFGSNVSIGVVKGTALTLSGVISDGGSAFSLTKTQGDGTIGGAPATLGAGGTLVLTGVNTYAGATTVEAGELRLQSAGQAIASTVVNIGDGSNNQATLTLGGSNQMPSNVVINFGNRALNAKFQLNGFNQTIKGFGGDAGVNGIIQNFETAGAGTSTLTVDTAGTDTAFNGRMRDQTGVLALTKTGAGTLTLSGISAQGGTNVITYTGATAVTGGTLKLTDATGFTSPITISAAGALEFNYNYGRTLSYTKVLTDNGLGFTKTGLGTLALATGSNNVVTGTANVSAGTLVIQGAIGASTILPGTPINVSAGAQLNLFGAAGATTYNNVVTLNGVTFGGALAGAVSGGTIDNTLSGQVNLNGPGMNNISTGWADKTFRVTGKITGAGGLQFDKLLYTQQAPVFQINNAANDYAGGTTINAGTVYFTAGLPGAGNMNFGGYFTQSTLNTLSGSNVVLGTNGLPGFNRAIGTGAGQVSFTGEGGGFSAVGLAATVNFGGGFGSTDWGAAGWNAGATFWFNGSNALGGASAFNADNQVGVVNDIVLSTGGMRRIFVVDNNGSANDQANFSGAISGPGGLIKDGGNSAGVGTNNVNILGRLILSGASANTYAGVTDVIAGTLALNKTANINAIGGDLQIGGLQLGTAGGTRRIVYLGANEQIPDTATVSLIGSSANNGDLRLFGFNETVAAINDRSGGGVIEVAESGDTGFLNVAISTTATSTLTVGGTNADSFYNGFLRNNGANNATATGVLNLIKNGTGTLTLSQGQQSGPGNQTYSGTTTINGGQIVFANIGTYNSPVTVNVGNVGFLTNINQSLTDGQTINGAGTVQKDGLGTMILSGANGYVGLTTVNNGTLQITGAPTGTAGFTVNGGGTLLVGNGTTTGAIQDAGNILVNAGGTAAFSRNNGYTYAGIISGAGNVQSRAGGSATVLSGANTYSGSTTALVNSSLTIAGSGASAGGLVANSGGTLTLDFTLAGSNPAGIVAATAPVTLNGGTLAITGSGVANAQTLGAVALGIALPGGFAGQAPTQPGLGASNINLTSGAGGLNVTLGSITHVTGATANVVLPASGTVTTTGSAIGGIANGFTTTSAGTTWLAQDGGGVLTALAAYGADIYGIGVNTDVVAGGLGASTNSLRFNTAAATSVALIGPSILTSGGILVTSAVGANPSAITGFTLSGTTVAGLNIIQGNTGGSLTISSAIVDGLSGATGLTKSGAGTVVLTGVNTYGGDTVVNQGTLISIGALGSGAASAVPGATLQIGDGATNGVIPTFGTNTGNVFINNGTAQTLSARLNTAANFNFVAGAINNGTSFQTGNFTKFGAGTLTITAPLAASTFHLRAGTTVLDTGANVFSNSSNSVGQVAGDVATLTVKGAGRITQSGDFNVGEVAGTKGTLNIQDQGVVTGGNLFVGKFGTAIGVVNQSLGTVARSGGSNDWRIGGGTGAVSVPDQVAFGAYNLSGGSFQTNVNLQIGGSGRGIFNQTGGTVSATGGFPVVARYGGSFGELNVSNGTFTNTVNRLIIGENGSALLNVSGSGQVLLTGTAAGTGIALTNGAGSSGIVNLASGGLIVASQVADQDGSAANGTGIFNFNGGVLRVTTGSALGATFMTGLTGAVANAGGAIIDTNGVATTIAQPILGLTGNGVQSGSITVGSGGTGFANEPIISITGGGGTGATARAIMTGGTISSIQITSPGTGYTSAPTATVIGDSGAAVTTLTVAAPTANTNTGTFNKMGAGTLVLTGAGSTYGGATTVSGGTLTLNGQTATITSPALTFGSTIAYASNTANLAVGTGTFNFDNVGATAALAKVFAGNVTFSSGEGTVATTRTAAFDEKLTFANFAVTGTGTGNFAPINAGSATNGVAFTTAPTVGAVMNRGLFFGGTNYATYDVGGFVRALAYGTDANTNTSAAGATLTGPAATMNTNVTGAITAQTTAQFSTIKLGTTNGIVLAASQTLTVDGILKAGANSATISGGTALTSAGALLIARADLAGDTLIINTPITGAGVSLVKSGAGVLQLGATTLLNTYGGETVVNAGTLRIAVTESIPNASSVTIHTGASLDMNNLSETINGLSGVGSISTVAGTGTPTLTVGSGGASSVFGGVIANGTATTLLTKTGAGTLTLTGVNTYTGATNINTGAIAIAVPNALSQNTQINVNVAGGLLFDTTIPTISGLGGNSTFALQTQASSPVANAPVQLTLGNNNSIATYSGVLTGAGTIIKIGTGAQFLTGNNTSTGGVIANNGALILSGNNTGATGSMIASGGVIQINTSNSFIGAGNVIVATGGTLAFGAVTANPAVVGFGTISSGMNRIDSNSTGVLAVQTDGSLQTPVTENLNFSPTGPGGALNLSLGATLIAATNAGNAPVQYTGVITPNANTFRIGGGGGRLILPNSATLAGANSLFLYGGGTGGGVGNERLFLTGAYGFTGSTTVNAGITLITTLANGGNASSLGAAGAAASNLVLNGGTLSYIGTGSSTNRLFTISTAPTSLDSSGTGPVNFTGTGAVDFLSGGNRTLTLQGNNTGSNSLAAAIGDSVLTTGASGVLTNGTTAITKGGNGTWILGGANTFSGGVTINNGVLGFSSAAAIGANTVNGPASILVNSGGAAGLFGTLTTGIQTTLNRISPLSTGTVALTADSSESINFDGGGAGAALPQVSLGAYGNVNYSGTLTPFGAGYRLGGGGGVLTIAGGGLTGPRVLTIGGGGPGTSFVNNPNLNGAVILGGNSDYTGGTVLTTGGIVSATSLTALGTGPLKFQGGFYRAVDTTDITLASDGVSARDIRLGVDGTGASAAANIDVVSGVNVIFSKTLGAQPTFGSNQAQVTLTKYGAGTLTLAGGLNLAFSNGGTATNAGTLTIERGTLSILTNPTFYNGNIQVGSNNGGVGTLKLGGNNVFGTGTVALTGSIIDVYGGSNIDLAGFSDSVRIVRGMGGIINSGASSANLTVGTNSEIEILGGNLVGNFTLTVGGNQTNTVGGSGNVVGLELWNNNNVGFTGKLVANAGALRIRADGSLGATTEAFAADKITLNNGAVLINGTQAFVPLVIGANHGITLGSNGGTISAPNTAPMIINSPIAGSGMLTIGDETGTVYLNSSSNSYTGGTTITSASTRGFLAIGTGGTTGNLPAGDFYFNSAAGGGRLYFFKSSDMTVANNINGPGLVFQIGAGTTTLTGNNTNFQTANASSTFVGGGRLKADFTGVNAPIPTGTGLTISAGTFEYVGPAGDNTFRFQGLTATTFGTPAGFNGGVTGDATIQSTYGGSGSQTVLFNGNARGSAGVTINFVTTGAGSINGVNNSFVFVAGPTFNAPMGGAYTINGNDFAFLDSAGYVRPINPGVDLNASALNTLVGSQYAKLTTAITGQGAIAVSSINLAGSGTNITMNAGAALTLNANPGTFLKNGGGTSVIGGGAGATVSDNNQELIARTVDATDTLQIDIPITGTGAFTKSGLGQVTLTAANTYTGTTFVDQGTLLVTGSGVINLGVTGSEIRIANAAGQSATVAIDSALAAISNGTTANALRVGEAGAGFFNQSAGVVTVARYLALGENLGAAGTYNMTGGTLSVKTDNTSTGAALIVGRAGTGILNVDAGSTINVNLGAQVLVGVGTVNPGQFQTLVPNAGTSTGVGTITQIGGNINVAMNNGTYQGGVYGAVILGVDGTGTYSLNGGTLTTPMIGRGNGIATFNLGSGVLKAATPAATQPSVFNVDLPINLTGTGVGKGTIDTNGSDVAVTGALTGVGGFQKANGGVLSVLGSGSNFSGGTDITGGGIVASGTGLGTGAVNVGTGTNLTVQGVQQGLLAKFTVGTLTNITPGVTTGNVAMATELTSLSNFNTYMAGKPMIAVESTAARGKVAVNYLEDGVPNGTTAIPPALVALNNGNNPFIASMTGKFNAATAGDYTFQTRSDDASAMWVDGLPVLDNNRGQGVTNRTGTINLSAGFHDITIAWANTGGGQGFSAGVTLPGQGQSFVIGNELNMSNSLLSFGSNDLTIGALSGSGTVQLAAGVLTTAFNTVTSTFSGTMSGPAGSTFVKTGTGTETLSGTVDVPTIIANGGTLNVDTSVLNSPTVNANSTVNFSVSQTLDALNIGTVPFAAVDGFATDPDFGTAGSPALAPSSAVVPEPGSIGLLLVGALGLLGRRRRDAKA